MEVQRLAKQPLCGNVGRPNKQQQQQQEEEEEEEEEEGQTVAVVLV